MFRRIIYDKQNIFLNGNQVLGVVGFDSSVDFPSSPLYVMGTGFIGVSQDGEVTKSFNFSNILSDQDVSTISLFGQEVTGTFAYKKNEADPYTKWTALSSIITSYELTCSVGEIPNCAFSFDVLSGCSLSNDPAVLVAGNLNSLIIPAPGDLRVSGLSANDENLLQSITYRIEFPLSKKTFIGSKFNSTQTINDAILVEATMSFFNNDILPSGTFDCGEAVNAYFTFEKCDEFVRRFSIKNAKLVNATNSANIGDPFSAQLTYRTYVSNIQEAIDMATGVI